MKKKELGNKLGLVVCAGAALGLSSACLGADASDGPLESQSAEAEIIGDESEAAIAGGPADEVVLYDLPGFSGVSQSFGIGRYNVEDLTIIGNDRASSIRVPAGLRVTVFFNANFDEGAYVYTSDTDLVAAGTNGVSVSANDIISSIVVSRASDPQLDVVTFYENANFSGESFVYSVGGNFLFNGPWNWRISSVRVPPGFKVTLYDGYFWTSPNSRVLTADANLAPLGFDDETQTFIIERL
ncbi:beta/gamma crystallin domain-containing protein [Sorangium sp. So ce321]|uniref:beta/gamma crystallin domain-containing protein n=1 Tax=Sorangium sp. So ce321 TaxID=3133300 RepID=UPI003F61D48B